jgi:hypothetical protein
MRYVKKPSPPQGNGAQEVWMRRFMAWISQFELNGVVGGIKKPNPNGDGYSLVIDRQTAGGDANPFRIYQSGDWLHYKVTTGWVVRDGVPILATNIETELPITASVQYYWFYLELTDTTAAINTSATTLVWSCTKIPLGWVDTLTGVATDTPAITNLIRDHLFSPL